MDKVHSERQTGEMTFDKCFMLYFHSYLNTNIMLATLLM